MTAPLTVRDAFEADGFFLGLPVLTEAEAADAVASLHALEQAEIARRGGRWTERDHRPWEGTPHPLSDWAHQLAAHPRLVDAVSAILGPTVLVRNADVFVKDPAGDEDIAWHLDTRRTDPDVDGMLTAWLALTPGRRRTGAVEYARGSHRLDLSDGASTRHQLTLDRRAMASLDPASFVRPTTPAGHANLHHFRTAHRSGPNRDTVRRVAFVVRYMRPDVSPEVAESGSALAVRGTDHGAFLPLTEPPITWTGPT